MRVLSVFGTRPEAIKMAPVMKQLERYPDRIVSRVCVTAQHRQMLDQVLALFGIVPEYDLNVMQDSQSPTQVAAAILMGLEPILQVERPDWVLVQGDTTTVAAASLAAFYARVKVAHVEAGLRTHDKWQPFPEEINRRVVGVIADLHFAPTQIAYQNLLAEGVPGERILIAGNPVIDALDWVVKLPVDFADFPVQQSIFEHSSKLILVTAHRRENFGPPLESICLALREIATRYGGQVHIVYPVHLNPNVQEPVNRLLSGLSNISLISSLDYLRFAHLMRFSYLVLTDSGGIQEEAPALGVPVLVLRDTTERPEAVEAGAVKLVGTDQARIVREVGHLLDDRVAHDQMARSVSPYGDGHAAERIVAALLGEQVEHWQPER